MSLFRPGEAYEGALRVGEMADDKSIWRGRWTHDTCTSELFGTLQSCLDIGYANVKDSVAFVSGPTSDASGDSCPIFGSDYIQKSIGVRSRHFFRHG